MAGAPIGVIGSAGWLAGLFLHTTYASTQHNGHITSRACADHRRAPQQPVVYDLTERLFSEMAVELNLARSRMEQGAQQRFLGGDTTRSHDPAHQSVCYLDVFLGVVELAAALPSISRPRQVTSHLPAVGE